MVLLGYRERETYLIENKKSEVLSALMAQLLGLLSVGKFPTYVATPSPLPGVTAARLTSIASPCSSNASNLASPDGVAFVLCCIARLVA